MTAISDRQQLADLAAQAADNRLNVDFESEGMTLNIGPQHPATHGTLRIVAKLDGEQVVSAEPVAGYMHRGYEKLTEVRTYPQVTTLINRIDWLGSFANEVPFILAAEKLMDIEAPPRAQFIRTILFELSRIANISLFLGDLGIQLGGLSVGFYAFRDREFVLNQIEAVTGGRFHPNFDRIGGLKDDLPKGWIAETHTAMDKLRDVLRRGRGHPHRQRDLPEAHPRRRHHPARDGQVLRTVRAPTSAAAASTGTSAATAARRARLRQGRLEGLDPPRRRRLRPLVDPPAGDPRGHQDRRSAARRHPERPDHGQGAAHHQGARGRGLGRHREPARRDGLLRRQQGRPRAVPGQDPLGRRSTTSRSCPGCCRGVYVPDVITILASLYFILGDIDR